MIDDNTGARRNRVNSPVGWAVGVIFVVFVIGWFFFYDGRGGQTTQSPANTPNVVTGKK
jgi:hypothetical protein